MQTWRHSHNLVQTTRDRLNAVVAELGVERANIQAPGSALSASQQADLQRVDKALALLQQALAALAG